MEESILLEEEEDMKTKFVGAFLLAVAIALIPVAASAAPGNPHSEEQDGSDHGATGVPARDDPSSNGKDCDVHGNHGGVNEDHCGTETTVTTVPVTVTTVPVTVTTIPVVVDDEPTTTTTAPAQDDGDEDEVTTTTVPVVVVPTTSTTAPVVVAPVVVPVPVVPAPVEEVPVVEAPHATCLDSGGFVYETAPGPCPNPALIVDHTLPVAPVAAPLGELPHTGAGTGFIGMVGFILVLFGAGIQLIFRPLLKA